MLTRLYLYRMRSNFRSFGRRVDGFRGGTKVCKFLLEFVRFSRLMWMRNGLVTNSGKLASSIVNVIESKRSFGSWETKNIPSKKRIWKQSGKIIVTLYQISVDLDTLLCWEFASLYVHWWWRRWAIKMGNLQRKETDLTTSRKPGSLEESSCQSSKLRAWRQNCDRIIVWGVDEELDLWIQQR